MKRRLFLIALAVLTSSICVLSTCQTGFAIAGSQFNAGRIVDDVVFFSANTMSAADIQNFMNSKVPTCDTNHVSTNGSNQPPFTCLKDYHQNTGNKSAETGLCNGYTGTANESSAQIIYKVAQSCGINPQVLLVLLQKEESLLTDTWPWNSQYQSATGYGCPDTAACDSTYYGFFNQVYASARQFRYYANNPSNFNYRMGRSNYILYNPSTSCGGSNVYLQDQATAGLYNYTPYQPNASALNNLYGSGDACGAYGNRNFWRLFNDWFGASVIGAIPSPLYKSTATQQIYVIAGGKKYPVASPAILVTYGLQRFAAADVSQTFLDEYPTGDGLTTIAKKENDPGGILYLFDDGKRYPINISDCANYPDGTAISNSTWKLGCFDSNVSKSLANELVDLYTVQDMQLPQLIINQGSVWKLENGKKRLVTDPVFVDVLGGWGNVKYMKDINASQPQGKLLIPDLSVVKFDNSPTLYYLANALLYPIPSPDEFNAFRLANRKVYTLAASSNSADPLSISPSPLSTFVSDSASNKYIVFTNGTKAPVTANSPWQSAQYTPLPSYVLDQVPTVDLSTVFRSTSGSIFTVQNNSKLVFPSPDDFAYSGYNGAQLEPVSQSAENTLGYGGARLSAGRLFKVSGDDTIHYVYGEGASLALTSTNIKGLPYNKLITVDAMTGARYPIVGTYH